ncbi:ankyrin repeat domain-containing protein [Planctomycetota bacterium]
MHAAAGGPFPDVLAALIAADADINAATGEARTPLRVAAAIGHAGCVRRLLEAGARLDARNGRRRTAAQIARDFRQRQMADFLDKAAGQGAGATEF